MTFRDSSYTLISAQVFNKSEAHTQGKILLTSSALVADHAAQICIPAERFPMGNVLDDRPKPRVGIFADTCNQYKAARTMWGGNINYQEIFRVACADRRLVMANAYVVRNPEDRSQPGFFSALRHLGYRLKEKELRFLNDGRREGNWDIGLTVDAVNLGSQLDVVVLVAGDGDYVPLVEDLQGKGCRVIVMSVPCALSNNLRDTANEVIMLDQPQFRYTNDSSGNCPQTPPSNGKSGLMGDEPVKI